MTGPTRSASGATRADGSAIDARVCWHSRRPPETDVQVTCAYPRRAGTTRVRDTFRSLVRAEQLPEETLFDVVKTVGRHVGEGAPIKT